MTFMNVADEDLKKLLSAEDYEYVTDYRLKPTNGFSRLFNLQSKVGEAIQSGLVATMHREAPNGGGTHYVISDDLGHAGILNHANGKMYDSKSRYYADIKAAGLTVIGNESQKQAKREDLPSVREDIQRAMQGY